MSLMEEPKVGKQVEDDAHISRWSNHMGEVSCKFNDVWNIIFSTIRESQIKKYNKNIYVGVHNNY